MAAQTIRITDASTGSSADVLVSLGFNCYSWQPVVADKPREMLWSHPDFASGQERPSSSGIPLLFPFPGRIGGAEYTFAGKRYQLNEGDDRGNALHGFVFNRPWRLTKQTDSSVSAEFQLSRDDADSLTMWPSDFKLTCCYKVQESELIFTATYQNVGNEELPCGFGTHAYFRVPLGERGQPEQVVLQAPVSHEWQCENMLPQAPPQELDAVTTLAEGVQLADRQFDTPYSHPQPPTPSVSELRDPASEIILRQTIDRPMACYVVYTPPHREAVCIEPYSCIPDPFRLTDEGQDVGLEILQPGESRTLTATLAVGS